MRAWPPFREAVDASRVALRTQTGLERSASEWDRAGPEDSYLLYGDRLRQAEAWLEAHGPEAASTGRLREFIGSSRAAVDAVERERQALYDRAEARRLAGQAELARLSGQVSLSVVLALGVASCAARPPSKAIWRYAAHWSSRPYLLGARQSHRGCTVLMSITLAPC